MDVGSEIGMMLLWLGIVGLIFCLIGLFVTGLCRLLANRKRSRRGGGPLLSTSDVRGRTIVIRMQ